MLRGLLPVAVFLGAGALGALEVPYLAGRVNDLADLMTEEEELRVTSKLEGFERATGAQIAVLTVPTLEGEVLEEYSLRVVETWGLGRAEQDDGVLLLVARDDRKMRIEVGYGLEGDLTDVQCGRILRNQQVAGRQEKARRQAGALGRVVVLEAPAVDLFPVDPEHHDEVGRDLQKRLLPVRADRLEGLQPLLGKATLVADPSSDQRLVSVAHIKDCLQALSVLPIPLFTLKC